MASAVVEATCAAIGISSSLYSEIGLFYTATYGSLCSGGFVMVVDVTELIFVIFQPVYCKKESFAVYDFC